MREYLPPIRSTSCLLALALASMGLIGHAQGSVDDDIALANRQSADAIRAYRATGLPWTAAEVRRDRPVSTKDNAATLLRSAIRKFDSAKFKKESLVLQREISGKASGVVGDPFRPYSSALMDAVAASSRPKADFGHDYDQGTAIRFTDESALKDLVKCLSYRALFESRRGDRAACVRDVRAAWRISNFLGQEPLLLDALIQIACRAIVIRSVERCALPLRHNPRDLMMLKSILQEHDHLDLAFTLSGEAYCGISTIRNLKELGGLKGLEDPESNHVKPIDPKKLVREGAPKDPTENAFLVRHLQAWTAVATRAIQNEMGTEAVGKALDSVYDDLANKKSASYMLEVILFPVFSQARTVLEKSDAETLAMEAMLTALARSRDDRSLPTSITQIPGNWIDPFTGKSMHVLNEPGKFRIYSFGETRKDHHGVFQSEMKTFSIHDFDIGAAYPPRAQR